MREMGNREEFPFSPPFFSSDFFSRGKNKMPPIFVSEKPPLATFQKRALEKNA